jgi:hypothetical protein
VIDLNQAHANTLILRLTRLAQVHGYSKVNALCKQAEGDLKKLEILLDHLLGDPHPPGAFAK